MAYLPTHILKIAAGLSLTTLSCLWSAQGELVQDFRHQAAEALDVGQAELAVEKLTKALYLGGDHMPSHLQLARAYLALGQHGRSMMSLKNAVRCGAGEKVSLLIARLYYGQGLFQDALNECKTLLRANEKLTDAWELAANCYDELGLTADAQECRSHVNGLKVFPEESEKREVFVPLEGEVMAKVFKFGNEKEPAPAPLPQPLPAPRVLDDANNAGMGSVMRERSKLSDAYGLVPLEHSYDLTTDTPAGAIKLNETDQKALQESSVMAYSPNRIKESKNPMPITPVIPPKIKTLTPPAALDLGLQEL